MAKRSATKPRPAAPKAARAARKTAGPGRGLVPAMLLSFGCGSGAAMLLLAAFAFALERFSLPLAAVQPMAVAAVWVGAAVSGWVLGSRLGRLRLLCGVACGVFYCLCLAAAGLVLAGTVDYRTVNLAVPIALLLGGLAGGTLSALRTVSGTLPR